MSKSRAAIIGTGNIARQHVKGLQAHAAQIGAVLADMAQGTVPLTAGREARNTIDLLTAIYKSSFTGLPVARGSIVAGDPFYSSFNGGHPGLRP